MYIKLTKSNIEKLRKAFRLLIHELYYADSFNMSTSEANKYLDDIVNELLDELKEA